MGERVKLTFLSEREINDRAEQKILDMIDDAYLNGGEITQPEIEKTLKKPPYKMPHSTICHKLKKLEEQKTIISWQENGVNHFDFAPKIPKPFKIAIIITATVFGIATIYNMLGNLIHPTQYSYLLGSGHVESFISRFPELMVALVISIMNFTWAGIWHQNNKNK